MWVLVKRAENQKAENRKQKQKQKRNKKANQERNKKDWKEMLTRDQQIQIKPKGGWK